MDKRKRRWARGAGIAAGALIVLLALAYATLDRWIFIALNPGPFDPGKTPPAPDYSSAAAWAALPSTEDGADVALPELPAIDPKDAKADVFYVHPTTALGKHWNAPIDDPAIVEATTRGGTLIQASAFNACCAVYAPRYRQANGRAFTEPDQESARALDVAYADISAAFDSFLVRNAGRPFILASHSQGTFLSSRLLRERILGRDLEKRMVAAYLIGGPLRADTLGKDARVCGSATDTGCVVAWNARAPGYEPNDFEFAVDGKRTVEGRICVNPLTWKNDEEAAPAAANAGALFFDTPKKPRILPSFAAARCSKGALVVTELGELERDFMSAVLLRMMPKNYHAIEYQLFYVNLRRNAAERVEAFLKR